MDLGSGSGVHESVEDNEGITNDLVSEKLGSASETKLQNNGTCVVDNNDTNELKQEGAEESARVDLKPEASSPFHSAMKKGFGLKKWRRIKRDTSREGGSVSSRDAGEMMAQELRYTGADRSKRLLHTDREQKTEGSVSSTNAAVRNFDGFALLDDSGLNQFAAGTDSENSEDRSSKSSTAASAPKAKYEIPLTGGSPRYNSKMRSLNGSNLRHPVPFGLRGKVRTDTGKKAKGERVKVEKENSHSSMESDSRSSNFVYAQGTYSVNNGVRNEGSNEYDGENGDEVQGVRELVNDEHESGEGFGDLSPEDAVADSPWVDSDERRENQSPLRDEDPLAESIRALQSAQEALEEEVHKLKEIGNEVEQKLQETSGEGSESSSQVLQSNAVETGIREVMTEVEELFKQRVEAEVEYLAISRTVQKLRVAAVDQITALGNYKSLASEQAQILGDGENKAKKEGEKLEESSVEELVKLERRVGKYGSCFAAQVVLLLLLFFIVQISQDYVEFVPLPT